jgi:hypothetical protein
LARIFLFRNLDQPSSDATTKGTPLHAKLDSLWKLPWATHNRSNGATDDTKISPDAQGRLGVWTRLNMDGYKVRVTRLSAYHSRPGSPLNQSRERVELVLRVSGTAPSSSRLDAADSRSAAVLLGIFERLSFLFIYLNVRLSDWFAGCMVHLPRGDWG